MCPFVSEEMGPQRAQWLHGPAACLCRGPPPAPEGCLGLAEYDCSEFWVSIRNALLNFSLEA